MVRGVDIVRQGTESDVERTLQVQPGGCADLMQRLSARGQEHGEDVSALFDSDGFR